MTISFIVIKTCMYDHGYVLCHFLLSLSLSLPFSFLPPSFSLLSLSQRGWMLSNGSLLLLNVSSISEGSWRCLLTVEDNVFIIASYDVEVYHRSKNGLCVLVSVHVL